MGTMDVSILELGDGVVEVLSTDGDTYLGGDDVDNAIIDFLNDTFKEQEGSQYDLKADPMSHQRLKEASEKAKIELSSSNSTEINLPYIMPIDGVPKHLVVSLTRAKFDQLIDSIVQRTIEPCKTALKEANITISEIDEVLLVGGSTRIPAIQTAVEKFFGKAPSKGVNPDECVAMGASIQGGILSGDDSVSDILLLDVTPMSLGIETMGGVMTKMIDANTTIPCKKTEVFTTGQDNQPSVPINIFQGERAKASDNKNLGMFMVDGIPPAPKATPQIEVTFDIDSNSILTVTAKDLGTGSVKNITIKDSNAISDEEIERMKADAKANEEADKKFEEEAKAVNKAENLVFQTEKTLEEHGDKLSDEVKEQVSDLISQMKDAKESKDISLIDEVEKSLQTTMATIYQDIAKTDSDNDTPKSENVEEEEVVETADFEEVKSESEEEKSK